MDPWNDKKSFHQDFIEKYRIDNFFHTLTIELTNKCQQRCLMCYHDHKVLTSDEELDFDKLKQFLIFMKKKGCLLLFITGGEPFLYSKIIELLTFVSNIGYAVEIVTNGLLLDKYAAVLNSFNIINIRLSILGFGETHDRIVGYKGAFNKVLENLKKIDKSVLYKIQPTITSLKDNFHEADKIRNFFKNEFGMKRIRFGRLVMNRHNYKRISKHIMTYEQIKLDIKRPKEIENIGKCKNTLEDLSLLSNGDIIPCSNMRNYIISNIYNKNILNNDKLLNIIKNDKFWELHKILEISGCKKCEFYNSCDVCVGLNYYENNDFAKTSKYQCLEKKIWEKVYKECAKKISV